MLKAVMCAGAWPKVGASTRKELSAHKDVCDLGVALVRSGRDFLVIHVQKYEDGGC